MSTLENKSMHSSFEEEEHSIYSKLTQDDLPPIDPKINVWVTVDGFGMVEDRPCQLCREDEGLPNEDVDMVVVQRYTFRNRNQMTVQVINYGAIITSIRVPDKYGHPEDVLMGFDSLEDYRSYGYLQMGATIRGENFNPKRKSVCCTDGWSPKREEIEDCCAENQTNCGEEKERGDGDPNGPMGCDTKLFDNSVWTPHLQDNILTLTHVTDCHAAGYPGRLMARATFELKNNNSFHVTYVVTTSKPTPVNIFNQLFMNLAGHGAGHKETYKHIVTLNADRIVCKGEDELPNGKIQCVGGTINDLRIPHELGPAISRCPYGGYDEYMCLIQGTEQTLTFVGRVVHPQSGRVLEMYTDQPGFQFYTTNRFPDPFENINPTEVYTQDYFEIPSANLGRLSKNRLSADKSMLKCGSNNSMLDYCEDFCVGGEDEGEGEYEEKSCTCNDSMAEPIAGKNGALYTRNGAFSITTQQYPNACNIPTFPSVTLYPGQMYKHEMVYTFGLYLDGTEKAPMEYCDEGGEEENEYEHPHCFPI